MKNFQVYREIVTDTGAYTAGDQIGQVQSIVGTGFDDTSGMLLKTARVQFRHGVTASCVLNLFNDAPIHSSMVNNGAFSLAYNDANKAIGSVRLSDKTSVAAVSAVKELKSNPNDENLPIAGVQSLTGAIYAQLLAGEAMTFAHTSGIGLSLLFTQPS